MVNEDLEAIITLIGAVFGAFILAYFTTNYLAMAVGMVLIFVTGYNTRGSANLLKKTVKKKVRKKSEEYWDNLLKNKKGGD